MVFGAVIARVAVLGGGREEGERKKREIDREIEREREKKERKKERKSKKEIDTD